MTIADLSITVTDGMTSYATGVNYVSGFPGFINGYTVTVTNNGPDTVPRPGQQPWRRPELRGIHQPLVEWQPRRH